MTFSVRDGRLHRDGAPFTALGVNYHPSAEGCDLWTLGDPETFAADFRRIRADGFNTVRLFLFWRDFMPAPDAVSQLSLDRLDRVVELAGEAGLTCVLSLLTIWMNGQLLDPPWRAGRSLWRDAGVVEAGLRYAADVAFTLRRHDNVLAYDLGDELWHIDQREAATLSRDDVRGWQRTLAGTIRENHPGTLVMQANDTSAVFGPGSYGVDNTAELDLVAVHGFPTWAPGAVESTLSYKATMLPGHLVRIAAAYGTPFVDELGSYGVDEDTSAAYLGVASASALAAGASGMLVWCWQDIVAETAPYATRPAERLVGLRRADGSVKPAGESCRRTLRGSADLTLRPDPPETKLYLPDLVRGDGSSYLDRPGSAVATMHAAFLLARAHLPFQAVAGDEPGGRLVVCPAAERLTVADLERLRRHAYVGGTVYLSLGDHVHAFPGTDLVGAEIVDFALDPSGQETLRWDSEEWPLAWDPATMRATTMRCVTAAELAHFPDGSPALVLNQVGAGRVLFCNAPLERQFDRPGHLTGTSWHTFYRRLAALAGVTPPVDCAEPDVELVAGIAADGRRKVAVLNHGTRKVETRVASAGAVPVDVVLAAKDWTVLDLEPEKTT